MGQSTWDTVTNYFNPSPQQPLNNPKNEIHDLLPLGVGHLPNQRRSPILWRLRTSKWERCWHWQWFCWTWWSFCQRIGHQQRSKWRIQLFQRIRQRRRHSFRLLRQRKRTEQLFRKINNADVCLEPNSNVLETHLNSILKK